MELVLVALVLFGGLVTCWLMLPGGEAETVSSFDTESANSSGVQRLA